VANEPVSGAYDQLVTHDLALKIKDLPAERVLREALESDEAPEILSRHLKFLFRRILSAINEKDDPLERIKISNRIVRVLGEITDDVVTSDDLIDESTTPVLWAITPETLDHALETPFVRLSESALLVNGRNQPKIGPEIRKELTTTDDVDLLCSFVKNTGFNLLERQLAGVVERGGRVRVLTTTYMGATQRTALDRLVRIGANVRVSYDSSTTRLHAKAWLLRRRTGATTAYIGSSNLSGAALTDGIEWNIRIGARDQEHIITAIASTFEDYWNDVEFVPYDPATDAARLDAALSHAGSTDSTPISLNFTAIEVLPRPFQQEVLDSLEFERSERGRTRNLVVMATGTGKTVVAGLDFRRLYQAGKVLSLLFVAHRKEILEQSLMTFRTIMRDGSFGELFVDGHRPTDWSAVFGSIQSLTGAIRDLNPDSFDMIIVDEFHHAAADSYEALLSRFTPKFLLGLTATPERSDGRPILHWFDDTISAELRLWEAIDRQILSPFQYFGIHDNTDLEAANITWRRGQGYDTAQLTNLYTANDARISLVLEKLHRYVGDLGAMKGIGFCVSVEHAEYMARKFDEAGIPSVAVTSRQTSEIRDTALRDLRSGSIKMVFAVDIFNEGVDIPDVNTILMLRPTESPTIFLQQLGRGLRKSESKDCLIVLDFVGNQNREFRFDRKYGALLGVGRRRLESEIQKDFPHLPVGCHIELDRVSKDIVLRNVRQSLTLRKGALLEEIRKIGEVTAIEFFNETRIAPRDFYRSDRSLTALLNEALGGPALGTDDLDIVRAIPRLLHVDDPERIDHYIALIEGAPIEPGNPLTMMFAHTVFAADVDAGSAQSCLVRLRESLVARELADVLRMRRGERIRTVLSIPGASVPLKVHATYSRAEIISGFGLKFTGKDREGVKFAKDVGADLAFVTLNKTEQHFSSSTMYADTALSATLFQWESQSQTSDTSETGQRYVHHRERGTSFHLFVREWTKDPETGRAMPYMYFGPADYLSHEGSKPMRIRWRLHFPIPADVLVRSKVIAS
jgi:superfamily II DNA or RNA helicase/HKD family nuclease